jgi:hypothetical protein
MNAVTPSKAAEIIEAVIAKGDLANLTAEERAKYYVRVCQTVGLNPMTRPFEYITLNQKLTLYARKDCTDQLRSLHNISVTELSESERDGVFIVTAKVTNGTRSDAAKGAVSIKGLAGENLANAMMKAETKAKRRATLSICGLGFLDESEVEDIPAAERSDPPGNGPLPPPPKTVTKAVSHQQREDPSPPTDNEFLYWRRDAEGALTGCEDAASLDEVRRTIINPAKGKVSVADWQAVTTVYMQTVDRLSMME